MRERAWTGFRLFPGATCYVQAFSNTLLLSYKLFFFEMRAQSGFCLSPVVFWPFQIPCG